MFIKARGANLGNMKARFRGITCNECNHVMGQIEEKTWSGLAISTMWKVIAGNINGAFDRAAWAQTQNSNPDTLNHYSEMLKDSLMNQKVFPNNMIGYDLNYSRTAGSDGKISLGILTDAEGIRVFTNPIRVSNVENGESYTYEIDFILYHSHQSNGHRLLFFIPLVPQPLKTPWCNSKIKISHTNFGVFAKEILEKEGVSCRLYNYFEDADQDRTPHH